MGSVLISPFSASNYEDVDFDIEKETWNLYELVDGSTVRVRTILFKLMRHKLGAQGQPPFVGGFQNIISAKGQARLKGPPATKLYSPEELEKAPKSEVGFSPLLEDWNVYRLKDGNRVKVKVVVSVVQRMKDLFDQFGDPMYLVSTSTVVAPVLKR